MKRRTWFTVAITALLCVGTSDLARADISFPEDAPPFSAVRKPRKKDTPTEDPRPVKPQASKPAASNLIVKQGEAEQPTQIIIPRNLLKAAGADAQVGLVAPPNFHWHTIVAGVALSLAFASLLLLRKSRPMTRLATTGVCFLIAAGVAGMAWANAPDPGPDRFPIPASELPAQVQIKIVDHGKAVTIIKGQGF